MTFPWTAISYIATANLGSVRFGLFKGLGGVAVRLLANEVSAYSIQCVQVFHVPVSDTDIQANFIEHVCIQTRKRSLCHETGVS